jgi:hypothetical protein
MTRIGMKRMLSICKRFGLACGLGAILVGSGVGVAVAQGWWQMGGGQNGGAPQVQNQAYFPVNRCINVGGAALIQYEFPSSGRPTHYRTPPIQSTLLSLRASTR